MLGIILKKLGKIKTLNALMITCCMLLVGGILMLTIK